MLKTCSRLFMLFIVTIGLECLATEQPKRFQEPTFPYPYQAEEVSFQNKIDHVQLSGTLTLPQGEGPFPAVILLHGSAPFDRDVSMFGHKFFLVWADYLTRQGIAVLRFDKRSAGKSTGNYTSSTLEDFAEDALAGLEYLKARKEINAQKIGLVGHSEGGTTALLAATKSNDVAFIISMAAVCVNWEQLIPEQGWALQRVDGVSEDMIRKSLKIRSQMISILKKEQNREKAETQLRNLLTQELDKLNASERKIVENYYGPLETQIQSYNSSWFRYNLAFDPVTALKKIKIPILALNGELDLVVSTRQNLALIEKTLKEIQHPDYKVIALPNLNHAFQTCQTGSVTEYEKIEETTSPKVLDIMAKWILEKR